MSASSSDPSSAPLLRPRNGESDASSGGGYPPQTTLALLLGRAVGRRGPSLLVRETAARELDVRRADWGYSAPVVALDMMWNISFVVVSVAVLIWTVHERPNVPVRVWICGYALQCLIHVVLVWFEYRKRVSRGVGLRRGEGSRRGGGGRGDETEIESDGDDDYGRIGMLGISNQIRASFVKRFESANTVVSFLWWIIGFYWVVCGGEVLLQDAPRLYWLTVVFLAFDVFFAVFCMVLALLIGIALCCCLPCIIAILYSVAGQDGASDADISILPKYRFRSTNSEEKPSVGAGLMIPEETSSGYVAAERVVLPEDAECCICLSSYEDGAKLIALPCNHNFHDTCIVKWLKMNATCPLCKFDIVKGNEPV